MIVEIIGNILIFIGVCITFIGLIGIYRFEDFYSKLMVSAKIDTVAIMTLILGVSLRSGMSWFTLKALLIMVLILFVNPIVASKIALSYHEDKLHDKELEKEREEKHGS